jgi:hypothetical protein
MPVYTEDQKALWNTLADLVRQHPAKDVLDAMSDAFRFQDEPDTDTRLMQCIARAIDQVSAENVVELAS